MRSSLAQGLLGAVRRRADYVIMYIPGEHFLAAALSRIIHCGDRAFERRVLLATQSLVAIARPSQASGGRAASEAAQESRHVGKESDRAGTRNAADDAASEKNLATANLIAIQPNGRQLDESQELTQASGSRRWARAARKTLDTPPRSKARSRPLTKVAQQLRNQFEGRPMIATKKSGTCNIGFRYSGGQIAVPSSGTSARRYSGANHSVNVPGVRRRS